MKTRGGGFTLYPPARHHLRCPGSIASRCFDRSAIFDNIASRCFDRFAMLRSLRDASISSLRDLRSHRFAMLAMLRSLRDLRFLDRFAIFGASLRGASIATRCFDRCAIFDRTFSKVRKVTVILTVFAPHAFARERRHGASYKFKSPFALARFRSPRSLEQIAWFSNFLHSFEKKKLQAFN